MHTPLLPFRTRLVVFAVLTLIAIASIKLIDDRAMIRMREFELQQERPGSQSPAR